MCVCHVVLAASKRGSLSDANVAVCFIVLLLVAVVVVAFMRAIKKFCQTFFAL